jgi:RimJ/RimL family protein N-acetyltransferase
MLASPRLRYQALTIDHLDRFHALVQDAHVRRYLLDGEVFPREWSEARVRESEALVARRGVGLWLVSEKVSGALAGFCGFLEIPSVHAEPQLVYALVEQFTGKGYATEMARAAIDDARAHSGFAEIVAAADEVNVASIRVLEKLGFARIATGTGAFGRTFTYSLSP